MLTRKVLLPQCDGFAQNLFRFIASSEFVEDQTLNGQGGGETNVFGIGVFAVVSRTRLIVALASSCSTFPIGTTNVTCTAIDSSGNTAQCSFAVCVFSACLLDQSNPGNVALFNTLTGDYRFCCSGTLLATGKGVLTMRGCIETIDDQKGGHNYKTAAAELGVTVHMVSFHLRSIYDKLQVHSKSEAVAKALQNRLI